MVKLRLIIGILVVIGVLGGMSAGVHAQEEGLVAEWHFDEGEGSVLKDSSGNGNDGVIYGATWVDGKFGKALSFDGVDDYVEVPDTPQLSGGGKDLTIEAWIKPNNLGENSIISKNKDSSSKDWSFRIQKNKLFFVYEKNANNYVGLYGNSALSTNVWHHVALVYRFSDKKTVLYLNGINDRTATLPTDLPDTNTPVQIGRVGGSYGCIKHFNGIIDEMKIYNSALTAEEIKEHYESGPTALSLKKTASPQSIKQGQTAIITLTVKNTGSTEIRDIEIADTIPSYLTFIDGETSKRYDSLAPKDTRQIFYTLQFNDAGTFNLEPAIATYANDKGNYKTVESKPASIEVIRSIIEDSSPTPKPTNGNVQSASVNLHGEKTDVALGEDVLLKLSAVNIIGNPTMHVQVIIIPPSGWSVTSSEFAKSGAGQYTTTYELESGGGKDIEVRIVPNQIGDDFQVEGRIIYYFGDDVEAREDHSLSLPIKVQAKSVDASLITNQSNNNPKDTPGFGLIFAIGSVVLVWYIQLRGGKNV